MLVKHNYNCSLCDRQKTCFVFQDFSMLFAVCKECFDQFQRDFDSYEVLAEETCSFCDKVRDVREISGFEHSSFFLAPKMCEVCKGVIVKKISSQK